MMCSAEVGGFIQKHWQLQDIQGGRITFGREKKGVAIILFLADRRNVNKLFASVQVAAVQHRCM